MIDLFLASIADIWSFVKACTAFLLEIPACLVAGRAESAFNAAKNDLSTGISLSGSEAVDTKIFGIIESVFVIPIGKSVSANFFWDGSSAFAQKGSNVFKGSTFGQPVFNIDPVI